MVINTEMKSMTLSNLSKKRWKVINEKDEWVDTKPVAWSADELKAQLAESTRSVNLINLLLSDNVEMRDQLAMRDGEKVLTVENDKKKKRAKKRPSRRRIPKSMDLNAILRYRRGK